MRADVDEAPAALQLLVGEHAPGRHRLAPRGVRLGEVHMAQRALAAGLVQRLRVLAEAVLIADGELLPRAARGVDHALRVRGGRGHGLLAHHVLARFKGVDRDLAVRGVRGQHVHHVDLRVREQLAIVRVRLRVRRAVLLGGLLRALRDQVAEGDDLAQLRQLGKGRQVLGVRDAAAADDADLKLFHRVLPPLTPTRGPCTS